MKKIIILIPVFNDWESLEKLIVEINENIKELKKIDIECLVINDASTIKQSKEKLQYQQSYKNPLLNTLKNLIFHLTLYKFSLIF